MKAIYMARDGAKFDTETECTEHEWILDNPEFMKIHFYKTFPDGDELEQDDNEEMFWRFLCKGTDKVVLPNESVKALQDFAEYMGFFEGIDSPGTWVLKEDKFVKVSDVC